MHLRSSGHIIVYGETHGARIRSEKADQMPLVTALEPLIGLILEAAASTAG